MSELIHEVSLPSQGILYESPQLAEKIIIRAITTKEEKLIFGSGTDSAISKALRACIISPEQFPLEELTIPDKHFLVVAWRALSYGPEYGTAGRCPVCGTTSEFVINIEDIVSSLRTIDTKYYEGYEITLPVSKDKISLHHLRDKDLDEIDKHVDRLKKKIRDVDDDVNLRYDYQIAYYIGKVNGVDMPLPEKIMYVNNLIGRDSSYIIHQASKMQDYGIDSFADVTCKKAGCESSFRVPLPVDWSFFRAYFAD